MQPTIQSNFKGTMKEQEKEMIGCIPLIALCVLFDAALIYAIILIFKL